MRKSLLSAVAAASLLMVASPTLAKGTWVAANPISGSTSFSVFGYNNKNIVTGDYVDASGNTHGFIGPFDGSKYTSFDDPDGATQPRGLNDGNITTGFDTGTLVPWERTAKGTLTDVTKKNTNLNQLAQGINKAGAFAGNSEDVSGASFGYLGKKSKYVKTIKLSISNTGYAGRAIDTAGDLGGWYYDSSSVQHGFVIVGKKASSVDYPNAAYTVVEGMNDNGLVSGQWEDASGVIHGFIYTIKTGKFQSLDAPGASETQAWGINNSNVVAVSTTTVGSFVYCMTKTGCPKSGAGVSNMQHGKLAPAAP
ncbi:MAG TPA: hypothetical protein VGK90_14005 [Rhizomicrobium sp.]|jgi:hypothetical protein